MLSVFEGLCKPAKSFQHLAGSFGTSQPYSVHAKRCFGTQIPPTTETRPLPSRNCASQRSRSPESQPNALPPAEAALAGAAVQSLIVLTRKLLHNCRHDAAMWEPYGPLPQHAWNAMSHEESMRLRGALKEAKKQARSAKEAAQIAIKEKAASDSRMIWYKTREAKLRVARRNLEAQNAHAMRSVSYAHDVVNALKTALAHKVYSCS